MDDSFEPTSNRNPEDTGLPPGLSYTPAPAAQTPAPSPPTVPVGDDAGLPPGLSYSPQRPPSTPPGPAPSQTPPTDTGLEEVPGAYDALKQTFQRNLSKQLANEAAGVQVFTRMKTPEDLLIEAQRTPEQKDAIDRLMEKNLAQGWSSVPWWMAQLGSNVGSMVPGLGYGAAAGAVTGGLGAAGAFGLEQGLASFRPAYLAARQAGMNDDDAIWQALKVSGISAGFAGAMGLTPLRPLTATNPVVVDGIVKQALVSPTKEAMVQLGMVQPSLAVGQHVATSLAQGQGVPDPVDIATTAVTGVFTGGAIHGVFKGIEKINDLRRAAMPSGAPASEKSIEEAFKAQTAEAVGAGFEQFDRDLVSNEIHPVWYNQAGRVLAEKMPETATPKKVMDILRGNGIPDEMIDRSLIPAFLENQNGEVNKAEVLAHIEANTIQIREVETSDALNSAINKFDTFIESMVFQGRAHSSQWTPEERARELELRNAVQEARKLGLPMLEHPQPWQWLPGPKEGRRELVLYTDDPVENRAIQLAEDIYGPGTWRGLKPGTRLEFYRRANESLRAELGKTPIVARDMPHWPQVSNPVGHVRAEVRRSPTGKQTLVMLELQSLHQEAEREGYIGEQTRTLEQVNADLNESYKTMFPIMKKYEAALPIYLEMDKLTKEEKRAAFRHRALMAERRKVRTPDEERVVPIELPFKTDWQELLIKRMMRYAVDNGFDELALPSGDIVGLRLDGKEQLSGARRNYDQKGPDLMRKWAKAIGAETEYRRLDDVTPQAAAQEAVDRFRGPEGRLKAYEEMGLINGRRPFNNTIFVMKLNQWASDFISKGMPMDRDLEPKAPRVEPGRTLSDMIEKQLNPEWRKLLPTARKIDKFMNRIGGELRLTRAIEFKLGEFDPRPGGRGQGYRGRFVGVNPVTGNYVVEVNMKYMKTPQDLYGSMAHEFGHVIQDNLYESAPAHEKAAIDKAYLDFIAKIPDDQMKVGAVRRLRDNMISLQTGARADHDGLRLSDIVPGSKNYFLSKQEWFAEQVARWMTTDAKPLGVADNFFKRLANTIRRMWAAFSKTDPGVGAPDKIVADWLNKRWTERAPDIEPIQEQFELDSLKANAAAIEKGGTESKAVVQTDSTGAGRGIVGNLPPSQQGPGKEMAAHGDRMNWFFRFMLGLPQVADLNRDNIPLQNYTSIHRMANEIKNQIMGAAERRVQQWATTVRSLKDQKALTDLIDDYANGRFKLPHTEDGIFRRPNKEEFAALVKKHGVSDAGIRVFQGITQDFDEFVKRYRQILVDDARRIKDPQQQLLNIQNINLAVDKILNRPFIPLSRFGKYLVTVRAHDGTIRHVEQTNSLRRQKQIKEALEAHFDRLPGDEVLMGEVPKDATPFLGMPPGLINVIADKLQLSSGQRAVLDQLRFDYAPGHSFKHQFRTLDLVPGYSTDFMRNYAHFFFHGGNHLTRIQFGDQMRDQINALRGATERYKRIGNPTGANKLDQIANFMSEHYDAWVDPKSDWATWRGVAFHMFLGFNPASAVNNLTQTAFMTLPYLASVYGDLKAAKAVMKASTDLNNFYKKGTILSAAPKKGEANTPENFIARARAEAVTRGVITETQSHQLAALSEDRNLLRRFGTKAESTWLKFSEASAWMFEMSEQWNRRLAFNAALNLAYQHPGHAEVLAARRADPLLFNELVNQKHWTEQEAGAFVAAVKGTATTQFEYSPWARPKIMRGPLGSTLFVFKLFTQNTLYNLMSNPAMAWRSMLVMAAMGGMMGLPFADNINSLLKTIAYRAFGKDFDLEDEARKAAVDFTHGYVDPDILTHGLAAKGFGIPHIMHSIGANWFPTVDMSRNVGMGSPLSFDLAKPLGPVKDPVHESWKQLESAAGAVFGYPLSIYDFSSSNSNFADWKKIETIAPRWFGNISHFFRYAYEGKEVNRAGNAVVRFNVGDTEQMMEILARAMGFQPRRLTEEWARIQARSEASTYWQLMREGLMRQFGEAVKTDDGESKERTIEAIRQFNEHLPPEARPMAITSKGLHSSVMQRMRAQQLDEQGIPVRKNEILIQQEVEKYYPQGWPKELQSIKPVQ